MTFAISYSPVKIKNATNQVFGIDVAVSTWMRAYFKYSRQSEFHFLIDTQNSVNEIAENAALMGIDINRIKPMDARFAKENLSLFRTIFRPNPEVGPRLWQRETLNRDGFAYCGLSHSIAGLEGGALLEQYCLSPSMEGDAIICPSQAIKSVIRRFWDLYEGYINERFGGKFKCPVQLPVIPLGIDLEKFDRIISPAKRTEQRQKLGINEDEIIILWVGRLSHAIKAHPLPMFRAVEEAAKKTGRKVHFLMQGYFVPDEAEQQFKDLARDFAPSVDVRFIASNDENFPDGLWACGDIFLSLIENMQESFGLTPIEAIAAGLPRVLTDWDGYRDSVTHGVDGFLIRTTQPAEGQGADLSSLLLDGREIYGGYLAKTAMSVSVDHHSAAEAIAVLIKNPALRHDMAEKAKQRLANYNWKNIIPAYEDLWNDLANQRAHALTRSPCPTWPAIPPQAPDPFTLYASFASAPLRETDTLAVIAKKDEIKLLWSHEINVFAMDMMLPIDQITQLINWLSGQGSAQVSDILAAIPSDDTPRKHRTLTWLLKLGIIGFC